MNKAILTKIPGGVGLIADLLPKNKEKFEDHSTNSNDVENTCGKYYINLMIKLANYILSLYAFYLAFKCGSKYPDLLAACCCSPFYIVYRLAKKC